MSDLFWLPKASDFETKLGAVTEKIDPTSALQALHGLTGYDLDFLDIGLLDRRLQEILPNVDRKKIQWPVLRLAILSSTTVYHYLPALRIAAFRRGFLLTIHVAPFNQYQQELLNPSSDVFTFAPDVMLLLMNADEIGVKMPLTASTEDVQQAVDQRVAAWAELWTRGTQAARVIQSTVVAPPTALFGDLDSMVPAAPYSLITRFNQALAKSVAGHGVLLFDQDRLAALVGKREWCSMPLWFHAKQDVPLSHAALFGDHVARVIAAGSGLSPKCLVLDLDNTVWGGVIGDDGLEGIEIGQGSGVGEAFLAFQSYVKQLKDRGVVLAVCSKNNLEQARLPFKEHPEMALHLDDISAFSANWDDKASQLQQLSKDLNLGLESFVFFDDNPAERQWVREALPMVSVPEVPEDPAEFVSCLSEAGYFEAAAFTHEDASRAASYQVNRQRAEAERSPADLDSFLKQLDMKMTVSPFETVDMTRIAQLVNKSNQFNLTTQRYTDVQLRQMASDPTTLTFQVRLKDRLADHGLISVLIAKTLPEGGLHIDTWLMSCRVLGRGVEHEVLNVLVDQARRSGRLWISGEYRPTPKNGLVKDHYKTLGFVPSGDTPGGQTWRLDLESFRETKTRIVTTIVERSAHDSR